MSKKKSSGQELEEFQENQIKINFNMPESLHKLLIETIQKRKNMEVDPDIPLPRGLRTEILNQSVVQWIYKGADEPVIGKTPTSRALIQLKNHLRKQAPQMSLGEIKTLIKEVLEVHDKRTIDKYVRLLGEKGYINFIGYDGYQVKTLFANMVPNSEIEED